MASGVLVHQFASGTWRLCSPGYAPRKLRRGRPRDPGADRPEPQEEVDVQDAIADGLLPNMISVALACALPQLSLDDPAIQDWAQGPVAGQA